jgi:CRISPR-associated helicase Cas3
MGTGKTEAALLAAEVLAARFGCGGVYFALPTMATSDAMFRRVADWIGNLDGIGVMSTYLAHGKAGLNDDFRGLMRPSSMTKVHDSDDMSCDTRAEVLSWLSGRKKGVLANMVVGTIDQLLFAALQAKHLVLRHLAFAGKVVVVDEVHAADDHMRMFLVRALEWLAAYGVPVVLLSATLPAAQRQELADGYRRGLGLASEPVPADAPYPAVTVVDATGVEIGSSPDEVVVPQPVTLRCLDDDLETLAVEFEAQLVDGGCVAVIRNTVGRAQEAARFLEERFGTDIVLHHSRFIATHRIRREAELRAELGRDSNRPTRRIVVGTQVLEQSLDVDFDLMVTDLAPVDLVLQRLGRLHRHDRGEAGRPPLLRQPTVLITGIDDWTDAGLPEPVGGSRIVYGASRLLRAAGVLGLSSSGTVSIDLASDIRALVERAYGDTPPVPDAWLPAVSMADRKQAEASDAQRAKAEPFRIPGIDELDGSLMGWLGYGDASEAENPRSEGAGRVRDTEDGIEVIVVQRRSDGEVVFIDDGSQYAGTSVVPTLGPPEWKLARALAGTTVRFPLLMTANPADFDAVLDALEAQAHEGWQESPWLAGQLALHLDDGWCAQVAGFDLHYDLRYGLSAVRRVS